MYKVMYTKETFDEMVKQDHHYNDYVYHHNADWAVVRLSYQFNYILNNTFDIPKIPKKIHQVWVGSKLPEEFKAYTKSWKKFNPDYEYKLWTDDNIHTLPTVNWLTYNTIRNQAQRSDYLRYHILNEHGGIYVDTDFQCLKSFDDLLYLDFFTGIGHGRYVELYIGLIGSIPHHPITEALVKGMTIIRGGHWRTVFNETGSYYFTRVFLKIAQLNVKGIAVFPMSFFYPFPSNKRGVDNFKSYVKDHSYAVHHWAVSWAKKPTR
jgi:mannosyltransferase OCH1-like enzyme